MTASTTATPPRPSGGAASDAPAGADRPGRHFAPSTVDLFFAAVALAVPLRWYLPLLNADGDLAIHLRMGNLILQHHIIPFTDQFSYTMAGQRLIPTSWLSEVLFALADRVGGLPGIAVFAGLILASTYALVALFLRRRGVDARLVVFGGLLSLLLGAIHWLPRPHIFTILGSIILLHLLERGEKQSLWPYAVLFMLWSNLHGGFVYGLIIVGTYVAGDIAEALLSGDRDLWLGRARRHGLALALAVPASLLNPGGVLLLLQIGSSLGSKHMVDTTVEYQSPNFHLLGPDFFLLLILLAILLLGRGRRRMPGPWLAVVSVNLFFALFAVRNIPLFGVTALPLLVTHISRAFPRQRERYLFGDDFASLERRAVAGVWVVPVTAAVLAIALAHGRIAGEQVIPTAFSDRHFPIEAVRDAREAHLSGRVFGEFIWAGYMIYAWPEQRVFASSQQYTDSVSSDYLKIYYLSPGWRQTLARWHIDLVLVPRTSILANALLHEPGWRVWYCDRTALLLARSGSATPAPRRPLCPPADPQLRP